jgi:PAS domain S-box-containing protein
MNFEDQTLLERLAAVFQGGRTPCPAGSFQLKRQVDGALAISHASDSLLQILALTAAALKTEPQSLFTCVVAEELPAFMRLLEEALANGTPLQWLGHCLVRGKACTLSFQMSPQDADPSCWDGVVIDLSGILARNELGRLIGLQAIQYLQQAAIGIWIENLAGEIRYVNDNYCKMSGYASSELLAMHVNQLDAWELGHETKARIARLLDTGQASFQAMHRRKDGSTYAVDVDCFYRPELSENFILSFIVEVAGSMPADTAQKPYKDISKMLSKRVRELQETLVGVSEAGLRYLGRELHDNAGQVVVSALMKLQMLQRQLSASQPDLVLTVNSVLDDLRVQLTLLRTLSQGLYPVALEEAGLLVMITELARDASTKEGIHCRFVHGKVNLQALSRQQNLQIYRIVQEALDNVVQHSGAVNVYLEIRVENDLLTLVLEDDGLGLKPGRAYQGPGLTLMAARARLIGGILDIGAAALGGTRVRLLLPLAQSTDKSKDN